MRFQSNASSCGPAALRNALLCLGITRSEQELETLSGCSAADGTSPKSVLKALRLIGQDSALGIPWGVINESREDVALLRLIFALQSGHPVIMVVDNDEHWVVAFGLLGNTVVHVVDSADSELVQHLNPSALMHRWHGQGRKPFYGIVV